jgi:hypothetical protein
VRRSLESKHQAQFIIVFNRNNKTLGTNYYYLSPFARVGKRRSPTHTHGSSRQTKEDRAEGDDDFLH